MARRTAKAPAGRLIFNAPACMGCGQQRGECACQEIDRAVQALVANGQGEMVLARLEKALGRGKGGQPRKAAVLPDVGGGRASQAYDDDDEAASFHPLFNQLASQAEARQDIEARRQQARQGRFGPTFNRREEPDDDEGGEAPLHPGYQDAVHYAEARRQLQNRRLA